MKSFYLIKPYFKENKYILFFGILFLITVDILQLFIPRIIKWAVDDLTYYKADMRQLFIYAAYIVITAIFICIFRYFWRRYLMGTSRRVEEGLRNHLFNHLNTLSAAYFDKHSTGDLMAHATNDITNIRMATGMGLVALTDAIFLGTAAICFMLYINVRLTVYTLIPMPVLVICARYFSRKLHKKYKDVQGKFADLTEVIRERFSGIRIVKAYTLEKISTEKVRSASNDYISANLSLVRVTGSFFPLMVLFTNISLAIVISVGGRQTILSTITTGDFVAFINYLNLMTWPMMAIGWVTSLIQRGQASLDRIDEIIKTGPEIKNTDAPIPLKAAPSTIKIKDLSFTYPAGVSPSLKHINMDIEKGKTIGITGPPGSGKTTLLSLIPRLMDPTEGEICFDNTPTGNAVLNDLRKTIGFSEQEPFLFSGTILENITFGAIDEPDETLISIVKKACLYDTIQSFPNRFNTTIGEKGVILSGGQKQRIALARALYQDRPILILDDPVSQVDMETGNHIINSIQQFSGMKTIIIVSHRLSAIKHADRIFILDGGEITASGTHEQLIHKNDFYKKMFRLQELETEITAS